MSVLAKLAKRKAFPIEVDGETVHIRLMFHREKRELLTLEPMWQQPFVLGCVLVEADGTPVLSRLEGQSAADFARQASEAIDFTEETWNVISDKLEKLQKPNIEALAKNS